ncbi:hypothetical protein BDA96_10G011900 [Sorghum bicolor]|uniref:Uncharacterized protein n=1 Tax=Sorghum bicolor TaxID=4558 RepID=A0A921TZ29_SORBI|nr:hypothetical protein BDA96_10G011900 [Sorghum bicolor]
MAEVLATMVVGPLVSMVKEKASSILLDQYKVMEGMEEQHKLLKRKLPAVLDVITDAEEQAAKNREGAKAWLEELRNVAYKANDVLDEFKYEALRRKAKAEGHYKEFGMDIIKLFPSHNRFMNTFRFKFKPQPPMSLKWRQTDPYIPSHSMNIASESRAEDKKKIVSALLDQSNNVGLTVLPIVGMGGMGKTTLAQLVYSDSAIEKHFQVRIWVCVSENFDVDSLFKIIVEEAKKNGCETRDGSALEETSDGSTLEKFKNAVSGKKYLLILDDVWNREANKWDKLRSYLHHGAPGSSVLTTTRDENIARFMGTIKAHKIKHLEESYIEDIIKTRAFSSPSEVPTELQNLVGDVAKRCSGSPLAATALGSVLRTKNTVQEWEAVLNRSTICDEENGILPILKLSYNYLPPHMRQCFAFCAMFPKDHKIDVEMLIRLWMANSFIPEQHGVCPEVTGKQIFKELAQRSFFQEVRQDRFYRQISCRIHDLMHDVAHDSMGKECATLNTELSQSEDFLYSGRHLFLSVDIPGNVVNDSREKGSLAIQTLICDWSRTLDVQHLSKYCRSVRALKTRQGSSLEPKYLHHLRYLDLSASDIEALSEDITILYHLQTLNLSYCRSLKNLPKAMKYMTALRHLYTHGCRKLKSMPPNLGHLTSLQTLTCFVAATGSRCSNLGELEKLDLGGKLELSRLENATGADAKAANLWDKKRLEELTLKWSDNHDKETDKEVLEGLRPRDGLKALRMFFYWSSGTPTWMLELQGMVELLLTNCKNLENLPALWQLPSLQVLDLHSLPNLHCLFSGGAPSKFQKLKRMALENMPKFETWWDTNEVQGEDPLFPEVEYLRIRDCGSLTALPKASSVVVKQSSGEDDTECRSTFPALREMDLHGLKKFHRWEAVDGTLGEQVTFPQLEKLTIWKCSGLTTFPEAPKLSTLDLEDCSEEASLQAASRYIASLSGLNLKASDNSDYNKEENSIEVVVRDHESPSPLGDLVLSRCSLFFSHSSAPALWNYFGQLSQLKIDGCDGLVYWPESLFQYLVSLRTLEIKRCDNLTGHTKEKASDEQSAPERSGTFLPRLESLVIYSCESLSLKSMAAFGHEDESTAKLSSSSASSNHCFFPCLESLEIERCRGLTKVASLPPSIKTLKISVCGSLVSLPGEAPPSLEELRIYECPCLESLPSGPHQVYSSLRVLCILNCPRIKHLPPSLHLQQRLNHHLQASGA